jgi:hypothetical protein
VDFPSRKVMEKGCEDKEMKEEEFLLKMGVPQSHIDRMKRDTCLSSCDYQLFYEFAGEEEIEDLRMVPVEKVGGLTGSRGEGGASWWDHFTGKVGNLDLVRIERLKEKLKALGLDHFRSTFAHPEYKIELGYYPWHDAYIVESDGNHRTIWAKIVGAPTIAARVYRFLPDHYKRYQRLVERKKQFENTVKHYNLIWKDSDLLAGEEQIPVWHFGRGYYNRRRYETDENIQWMMKEYDRMEKRLKRLGEIHERLSRFKNERIRDLLLRFLSLRSEIFLDEDPVVYSLLQKLYKAKWPGPGSQ